MQNLAGTTNWAVLFSTQAKARDPLEVLTVPKLRYHKTVLLKVLDAGQVTSFLLTRGPSSFPSFAVPEDLIAVIHIGHPSSWAGNRPRVT